MCRLSFGEAQGLRSRYAKARSTNAQLKWRTEEAEEEEDAKSLLLLRIGSLRLGSLRLGSLRLGSAEAKEAKKVKEAKAAKNQREGVAENKIIKDCKEDSKSATKKETKFFKVYKLSGHVGISILLQNSICFLTNRAHFIVCGNSFFPALREVDGNKKRVSSFLI
uniref:Uncharacterized protein n=1 Tax=Pediastrum duplex TaxID=3105 RepID=A0A1W5RN87_PEDDU|nr:hypothetical protein [Pediastrum duplex]AQU64442.1 hypothetical protein [Pediastrum duplex]